MNTTPPLCCAVPKELTAPHTLANRKASVWNRTGSWCGTRTMRCTSPSPTEPRGKGSFPCTADHRPCPCNCPNTRAFHVVPKEQQLLKGNTRSTTSKDIIQHALWLCVPIALADKLVSYHYRHNKPSSCFFFVLCFILSSILEWLVNDTEMLKRRIIFSVEQQRLEGQGLLFIEASKSHSETPPSVGLPWMSDQPVADTSTWQHTKLTTHRHPCPRRDSNAQPQQASGHRPTP
jgi:hypothetical protein